LCTKEDYERVGLGESFEEAANITNYNELCIDDWSFVLNENKKVTVYQDLRI